MPSAIRFMKMAIRLIVPELARVVKTAVLSGSVVLALAACSLGNLSGKGGPTSTTLYAATASGFSVSLSGGTSWFNFLGGTQVNGVFAVASGTTTTFYAATGTGLQVSSDGGSSWTTAQLGVITSVAVSGTSIYAGMNPGLAIYNGTAWNTFLPGQNVRGVFVSGLNVYAATTTGLWISVDGGNTWPGTASLSANVNGVYVSGSIYAATTTGVWISPDGGTSWNNYTKASNGLASDAVAGIFVSGSIYAATNAGLSVSSTGGTSWTTFTSLAGGGLGSDKVLAVYVSGTIYAATDGGLSISTNAGTSWTTATVGNGLPTNIVNGVFVQ